MNNLDMLKVGVEMFLKEFNCDTCYSDIISYRSLSLVGTRGPITYELVVTKETSRYVIRCSLLISGLRKSHAFYQSFDSAYYGKQLRDCFRELSTSMLLELAGGEDDEGTSKSND